MSQTLLPTITEIELAKLNAGKYQQLDKSGREIKSTPPLVEWAKTAHLPPLPYHPEPHTYKWTKCELETITKYGQACFEEGRNSIPPLEPMTEVADRCAASVAVAAEIGRTM
jgi:hypothetical protein